ncbi:hypothetical protein ACISU4_26505, partial [Streptomyces wuyuanensis]
MTACQESLVAAVSRPLPAGAAGSAVPPLVTGPTRGAASVPAAPPAALPAYGAAHRRVPAYAAVPDGPYRRPRSAVGHRLRAARATDTAKA